MSYQLKQLSRFILRHKKIIIAFLIGIIIRIIIAILFRLTNLNDLSLFENPLLFYTLEPYADYKYWYQTYAYNFIYTDWLPYSNPPISDFSTPLNLEDFFHLINQLFNQSSYISFYPPLYMYLITLPCLINIELVFLPIFIADILIPIIVYKFLVNIQGKKVAEWGCIVTVLCPLSMFYNGGLFLNTSIVTFFFILSLYFISIKKYKLGTFTLAISILIKQTIVLFIIPFIIYNVLQPSKDKKEPIKIYIARFFKHSSMLLITLFIGSLPWIIINPEAYVLQLMAGQGIKFSPIFNPLKINSPMSWYSFLIDLNAPYWLLYIVGFLNFTALGMIMAQIFASILIIYYHNQNKLDWLKFFDIIVIIAFLNHLFFIRGVYKYYFTFFVPLIILWICFHFGENLSNNRTKQESWFLMILGVSLLFLFTLRSFYLLIVWVLFFFIIRKNLVFQKEILNLEILK